MWISVRVRCLKCKGKINVSGNKERVRGWTIEDERRGEWIGGDSWCYVRTSCKLWPLIKLHNAAREQLTKHYEQVKTSQTWPWNSLGCLLCTQAKSSLCECVRRLTGNKCYTLKGSFLVKSVFHTFFRLISCLCVYLKCPALAALDPWWLKFQPLIIQKRILGELIKWRLREGGRERRKRTTETEGDDGV